MGDDGEELVAPDVVKQAGGISGGAYGSRAVFSAGVQFTITDPAVQVCGAAAHRGSLQLARRTNWQRLQAGVLILAPSACWPPCLLPACLPLPSPPQVQAFDGPGNGDPMLITSSTPGNDAAGTTASASATAAAAGTTASSSATASATAGSASATASATASAPASQAQECDDVTPPGGNSCQQQKGARGGGVGGCMLHQRWHQLAKPAQFTVG